jgi:hypothetical protein
LQLDAKAALARRGEKAVERRGAARLLVIQVGGEAGDARHGGAIDLACIGVGVIVRKVGGDDDQRLGPTPQALDDGRDLRHARAAHGEGRERELAELALQERQLHFQCVLLQMREVARDDLWHVAHTVERLAVDRHAAEGRGEGVVGGNRQAAHRHAVHRSQHDDTAHDTARVAELLVGASGDRAGIDVAGVGHDQRLREVQARFGLLDAAQELVELRREGARVPGIEHAGDGSGASGGHSPI